MSNEMLSVSSKLLKLSSWLVLTNGLLLQYQPASAQDDCRLQDLANQIQATTDSANFQNCKFSELSASMAGSVEQFTTAVTLLRTTIEEVSPDFTAAPEDGSNSKLEKSVSSLTKVGKRIKQFDWRGASDNREVALKTVRQGASKSNAIYSHLGEVDPGTLPVDQSISYCEARQSFRLIRLLAKRIKECADTAAETNPASES